MVRKGDVMTKSVILLVLVAIMVIEVSLSFNAVAFCTTCGGAQEDWSTSATNFIEGKPISDTPSSLSNPARIRQMNSDFNSNLLKDNTSNSATSPNNPAASSTLNMSTLNVSLKDLNAMPNPVNAGKPVMITASFGNNSSNSKSVPETNMTAYAVIRNSVGTEVGRVNLEHTSGEYVGIWNTNLTSGIYKATIVASTSSASKTFNDALQIEVRKAA
jgi:hypothetical protein